VSSTLLTKKKRSTRSKTHKFHISKKKFVLFKHHILEALNILYFEYLNIHIYTSFKCMCTLRFSMTLDLSHDRQSVK